VGSAAAGCNGKKSAIPTVSRLRQQPLGLTRAFSGKVDFRFSAENATTQDNLERVSAQVETT
jgi:hypothetical protein